MIGSLEYALTGSLPPGLDRRLILGEPTTWAEVESSVSECQYRCFGTPRLHYGTNGLILRWYGAFGSPDCRELAFSNYASHWAD